MTRESLSVITRIEHTTARISVAGELDLDTGARLCDELVALADNDVTAVVVDVSSVTFIDSSGLRALLAFREQIHASNAKFVVDGASAAVERVLQLTGLRDTLIRDS